MDAARQVAAYWDEAHDAYLAHVGTTFQAGRIASGGSMRDSNVWLARAAGITPGQLVLDAGCGVCGPAVDIARAIDGLRIVGVTLVRRQAMAGAALIERAHLGDRIHVVHADYHALPFPDATFDTVLFLESICYAAEFGSLFQDVRRVLRRGGRVYVKDVFRRDALWSDQERQELAEFDQAYALRTRTLTECAEAARAAGLHVTTRDLTDIVSTAHGRRAMVDEDGPTAFGRLHDRRHSCVPIYFAELSGQSPE